VIDSLANINQGFVLDVADPDKNKNVITAFSLETVYDSGGIF